jgi:hypothetical protein
MQAQTKRKILITLTALAGALLCAAAGWFMYYSAQFSDYFDPEYHFSIKYPKNWIVNKHPQENVAVVFLCPKETALDTIQQNFNVTVQPVPGHLASLNDFSDKIKQQMTAVFQKNIKIVEDKSIQFGMRQGHKMVIDAPNPDSMKLVCAWTIKGGSTAYILTFLGDFRRFEKYKAIVDTMISSFELK